MGGWKAMQANVGNVAHLSCSACACVSSLLLLRTAAVVRRRFRNPRLERVPRELQFRKVIDLCKRAKGCHYCGAANGTVK